MKKLCLILSIMFLGFSMRSQETKFKVDSTLIASIKEYYQFHHLATKLNIPNDTVFSKLDTYLETISKLSNSPNNKANDLVKMSTAKFLKAVLNDTQTYILIISQNFANEIDEFLSYAEEFLDVSYNNDYEEDSSTTNTQNADDILFNNIDGGSEQTAETTTTTTTEINPQQNFSGIEITIALVVFLIISGCFVYCFMSISTLKRNLKQMGIDISELQSKGNMPQRYNVANDRPYKPQDLSTQSSTRDADPYKQKQSKPKSPVKTPANTTVTTASATTSTENNTSQQSEVNTPEVKHVAQAQIPPSPKTSKIIKYIDKKSDTDTTFKVKSNRTVDEVFQLSIETTNSTTGEISLTKDLWNSSFTEGVINNYNTYLSNNFCEVITKSGNPQQVIVTEPGRAEKNGDVWHITSKVKITLE